MRVKACVQCYNYHKHYFVIFQYYKWFCSAVERGAQSVSSEGFITITQSQVTQCLSSTVGILCGPVP